MIDSLRLISSMMLLNLIFFDTVIADANTSFYKKFTGANSTRYNLPIYFEDRNAHPPLTPTDHFCAYNKEEEEIEPVTPIKSLKERRREKRNQREIKKINNKKTQLAHHKKATKNDIELKKLELENRRLELELEKMKIQQA